MAKINISRRDFLKTMVITASGSALAACSSSGAEENSENVSSVVAAPSAERVEIGFLNELVGSKEVGRTFLLAAFNAANDQIYSGHDGYGGGDTVHQKFLTALAGGVVPDLYHNEANYIPAYAEMDALEDLGPYLDASTRISKDDINPHPLDLCTYDGKIYGLPFYEDTMLLYYNKTLMEEAGLDPNAPPTDWAELQEQAAKIVKYDSSGKLEVAGCLLDAWSIRKCFLAALYSWGGQLLSDDGTKAAFNSQAGKDALQTLVDLILVHELGIVGWGLEFEDTPDEPFTAGKQGFMFDVPAAGKRVMRNNPGFTNWGTVGLPAGPAGAAAVSRPPAMMIPKAAKNKAEAWRVMEYWFDTKVMLRWALDISRAPATKSASADPELLRDPIIASLVETLKDTVDSPQTKYWAEMEDTLGAALELAIGGEKSVSDALDDAAAILDNMLLN